MKGAGRGLGLLVAAIAVVGAGAFWLLNEESAPRLERGGSAAGTTTAANDARLAAPASASQPEAQRAVEVDPANDASESSEVKGNWPRAEHLSGVVVDPNGRPIANAEVRFGPPEGFDFGRRFRGRGIVVMGNQQEGPPPAVTTRTDREGAFKLTQIPRVDNLGLRIDHPDYVLYRRDDLIVPSSGMELGRIALEPGASVSGHVFAPDGAKMAGVEVSLREAPDPSHPVFFGGFDFGPRGGRKTLTDAEGRFRLAGLPEGAALVAAVADGWCEATSPPVTLVPQQDVGGVVLHLERGHSISGIVRDGGGKPVAKASINANSNEYSPRRFAKAMRGEPDAVTGEDGRFTLPGLEAGVYEVTAEAEGFAPKSVAGIDAATGGPVELTLGDSSHVAGRLHIKGSSELPKNVKVQLQRYFGDQGMPAFETPDSDNAAKEDGSFLVADVDPGQYRVSARGDGTTRGLSAPITVEEGKSIEDVEIEVERGAVLAGRVVDAATGAPIANADVAGFAPRESDPPREGNVNVRRIGARLAGPAGRFNFDPERRNVGRTRTDAEGRFELQHLSAGSYELDVSHVDYATARSEPLEVAAAQTRRDADVKLGRGGTVEGEVLGIDGKPRSGDRIDVESKSVQGVTRSAVADANGWYRIEHVPAGDALASRAESGDSNPGTFVFGTIAIEAGGEAPPEKGKRIVVEEGKAQRVDFSQIEKPYVEGVVSSADGPVAGAIVTASSDGSGEVAGAIPFMFGPQKQATTGPDGRYRLADLDPGTWRLTARHPQGLVPTKAKVKLEAGSPARQDFALEGGVIEGDVVALKGGAKLEGALVNLERIQGPEEDGGGPQVTGEFVMAFAPARRGGGGRQTIRMGGDGGGGGRVSSDREGHYRVPWVPAGKYRVTATRDGFLLARSDEIEVKLNAHVDKVNLALPPAAGLVVTLRSKATGEPLAGCPVQLEHSEGSNEFGMTDAEGVARFDTLQPGTWTVTGKRSFNEASGPQKTVTCEAERAPEVTIDV